MTNSSQSHPTIMSNSPCVTGRPQKWIIITIIIIIYLKHGFRLGCRYFFWGRDWLHMQLFYEDIIGKSRRYSAQRYIYIYIHALVWYRCFWTCGIPKLYRTPKKWYVSCGKTVLMTSGSGGADSVAQKQQVGWFNQPQMYHPSEV